MATTKTNKLPGRLLGLAAWLLCGTAAAEPATLTQPDRLRSAPYLEADVTGTVPARARVDIVDTRGAWVRIKAAAGEGWVRATAVNRDAVAAPAVASLAAASGRQAVTAPTATLGIRSVTPGAGAAHALIMSISRYQDGIPELPGVKHDAAKAAAIAQSMGVPPGNIEYLKDEQVTVAGIDRTLDRLYERIAPGDQVFIYYSGHGGRSVLIEPTPRCAESLVAVNGEPYLDSQLERQLKRLAGKAGKIIAFLDACHSGGVTTRALAGKSEFRPKSWSKSDAQTCVKPVNVLTRSLNAPTPGSGAGNFVYIAAARDNEIALDSSTTGGLATSAWSDCIAGAAVDRDGSGALSAREVLACAQAKIDQAIGSSTTVLPHHVTITGNADTVLAFPRSAPAPQPASLASAPTTQPQPPSVASAATLPPPSVVSAPATAAPALAAPLAPPAAPAVVTPTGPAATLNDLFSNRDDRRRVDVVLSKPRLRIGQDMLSMTVTSTHPGLVYVLMAGSDGKGFDLLFPNLLDRDNQLAAGKAMVLPRPGWDVVPQGPAGTDRLLVIVSDAVRDFKSLPLQASGPFSAIEASATTAKDIQLVFGGTGTPASPECRDGPAKRTLAVVKKCSTAYGAALVDIEEVP